MTITACLSTTMCDCRSCSKGFLEPHDVVVTTVANGAAALDAIERQTFDVVVLDVMMPGMDGLEVLRRIRARSRNARVDADGSRRRNRPHRRS